MTLNFSYFILQICIIIAWKTFLYKQKHMVCYVIALELVKQLNKQPV